MFTDVWARTVAYVCIKIVFVDVCITINRTTCFLGTARQLPPAIDCFRSRRIFLARSTIYILCLYTLRYTVSQTSSDTLQVSRYYGLFTLHPRLYGVVWASVGQPGLVCDCLS